MNKVFRFTFAELVSNVHEEIGNGIVFIENESLKAGLCAKSKINCPGSGTGKRLGWLHATYVETIFYIFKHTHSYTPYNILQIAFCQNTSDLPTPFFILTFPGGK